MKKTWLCLLLCGFLLLAGCGSEKVSPQTTQAPEDLQTTVMIYMVGSDLEAKSGAGTGDMEEIIASGVDLAKTNVLIYAGGAPKWHNDLADPEKHSVLQLKDTGFELVTELKAFSMGESQCLSNFLKYGYSNFPAQQYALILWDHGNGPVIGYGKDMLFDNDSLTLQEMRSALEDSPFNETNKLKWVGFDACLMASAELALTWAPYAEYIVASQEVEPAFGWNYDFMASVTKADTRQMLTELAQGYIDACLAYFEERGYENRDTTLSCMDLSHARELEGAINSLFAKASQDVTNQYNQLTARREKTRALGRASTGSEYDLIDLNDMGMWLGQMFPEEVTALQQVLEKMTVVNLNNTENLCGMSLYYPFYNKRYYQKDWSQAYKDLGLLPEYQAYLREYEKIWLSNDKLKLATSVKPSMATKETYTLQLTPEQAESYASSRYYILQRYGEELYNPIFVSSNITEKDGLLTANFDGNILYTKTGLGDYHIPVSVEHDTVGDITRYSVYTYFDNRPSLLATVPEDYEVKQECFRYQLAVNNATKEIGISALLPSDEEVASQGILGGKTQEVDLSEWVTATFPQQRYLYLTRYDSGVVSPLSDWPTANVLSATELHIADGIEYVYAPLTSGEYCIIFEVEDTQGNRYCSELLPIQVSGKLPEKEPTPTVEKTWDQEDRLILWEQEDFTVFMEQVETFYGKDYTIGIDNRTDRAVLAYMGNAFVNETIDLTNQGKLIIFEAMPGKTTVDDTGILDWGPLGDLQAIDLVSSMTFQIEVQDALNLKTLLAPQWVHVDIGENYRLKKLPSTYGTFWEMTSPSRGMYASEQVLCETEDYRVTLLAMGTEAEPIGEPDLRLGLKIDNLSEAEIYPTLQGVVLDGIFRGSLGGPNCIQPGCTAYVAARVDEDDLNNAYLTDIRDAQIVMRFDQNYTTLGLGGYSRIEQYPVQLSQAGQGSPLPTEGEIVFDEHDVRIRMLRYEASQWSDEWFVLVENNSDQDICLSAINSVINGQALDDTSFDGAAIYDATIPARQKSIARFSLIHFGDVDLKDMSFDILIQDFTKQKVLFAGETRIELTVPEES